MNFFPPTAINLRLGGGAAKEKETSVKLRCRKRKDKEIRKTSFPREFLLVIFMDFAKTQTNAGH